MVARSVSMWGPNAQGVRSRPDRSVSLNPGDVQRMGGLEEFLFWSRDNPRPYGMSGEPRDVSKLSARARSWVESMGFDVDDLHEPMADDLEDLAEAEIDERDTGEVFEERQQAGMERDYQRILDDRQQQVDDAEAAAAAWQDAERDASVGDPEWDGFPAEMRGLSGEERALTGQTGGFAPSPPMSGSLPNRPTNLPAGSPGFDARSPELLRALQASSQRVNPQQEVFDGMGGWREQLAEARQKLKEAERREAERAAARHVGRPIPEGPPIPGNQNPESGAASRFAPSGQLPVDPTTFRAPQGQTVDWFNNLSTEQKIGMALMLMSGGMAAGGGAAAAGGGAALRYGAGTLLPLILNQ